MGLRGRLTAHRRGRGGARAGGGPEGADRPMPIEMPTSRKVGDQKSLLMAGSPVHFGKKLDKMEGKLGGSGL